MYPFILENTQDGARLLSLYQRERGGSFSTQTSPVTCQSLDISTTSVTLS